MMKCGECGGKLPEKWQGQVCPDCVLGVEVEAEEGEFFEKLVSGHAVVREIARGGMGIVYEAVDEEVNRRVALKMLMPHIADREGMRERFRIEVKALAGLEHAAILPVYSVGESEGLPFMTMKLADGGTLADCREDLAGDWRGIAKLLVRMADAVDHAHAHGLLHRDIKPANILFDENGESFLSDFGLAKLVGSDSQLTLPMQFLGTPDYVAPEVAAKDGSAASVASDLWSLGAVMHELLVGELPFRGEGLPALLRSIVEDEPLLAKKEGDIPRDLRIICLKCLAKAPRDRYSSARELGEDLKAWLERRPIKARRPMFVERVWYRVRRNPVLSLLLFGLLAAATVIGVQEWSAGWATRLALADSLLDEAKLERQTGRFDRKGAALEAINRALEIRKTPELRDELVSVLAWPGLELKSVATAPNVDMTFSLKSRLLAIVEGDEVVVKDLTLGEEISRSTIDSNKYHIVGPFTPDERFLIVRLSEHLEFRDVKTGQIVLAIPETHFSLAFDEHGRRMAAAIRGGNVRIYHLNREVPVGQDLGPLTYRLIPKAFSPDGKVLAVKREYTSKNALSLVDVRTGVAVNEVSVPRAGNTQRAVFAEDGASLFAAFSGGNIHRIPLEEGAPSLVFSGHSDKVTWVGLLEGGRILISQAEDETTRFWDAATGDVLAILPWSGAYHGCQATLGNRFFVRRGLEFVEGEIQQSEVCTTVALPDPDPDYSAPKGRWEIEMEPSGKWLAVSAQQNLHFMETESWKVKQSFDVLAIYDLDFAPGSGNLIAGRMLSVFQYFQGAGGRWREMMFHLARKTARQVGWAGDERGIAISWSGVGVNFEGGRNGAPAGIFEDKEIEATAISGDLSMLFAVGGGRLRAYDLGGELELRSEWDTGRVRSMEADEEGARVLAGGLEEYQMWEVGNNEPIWKLRHDLSSEEYRPSAWAMDASLLAIALNDYSVSLVDAESGEVLVRLEHPNRHRVWGVAMTPDGRHVAVLTSGHLVKIWHLEELGERLKKQGFILPSFSK